MAAVLLHPSGGLKGIPEGARVVMMLTGVTPATEEPARSLTAILLAHPRVERAITRTLHRG